MKDHTIVVALTCLLMVTYCAPVQADGFAFPKFSNPFKASSTSSSPAEPPRATGADISDTERSSVHQPSAFSLPKLKLPKLELPSFMREVEETSASRSSPRSTTTTREPASGRTTSTRQSRANQNRPAQPSPLDKFSQGTKSFFSKAKTTLMPWTEDTASTTPQRRITPSGSGSLHSSRANGRSRNASRSNSGDREASNSSGFTLPWLKPKPEARREINSATEFLALPREKYY